MTDRELLELAAKAAGIQGFSGEDWTGVYFCTPANPDVPRSEPVIYKWLTDDGDALRLANELELNTFHVGGNAYAMESESDGSDEQVVSYRDCKDKNEAMRRAITRAAAEIGKAMQ